MKVELDFEGCEEKRFPEVVDYVLEQLNTIEVTVAKDLPMGVIPTGNTSHKIHLGKVFQKKDIVNNWSSLKIKSINSTQ